MPEQKPYAELEIGLHRVRPEAHMVELRFTNPASDSEINPVKGEAVFDTAALIAQQLDPAAYGTALWSMLFADANVQAMYRQVKTSVESLNQSLRVRLLIGPSAPELHSLRWELLFPSERILFSRFLTSQDWRTIKLHAKSNLTALVAVSAPTDLARFQMEPVDIDGEIARAKEQLAGISVTTLGKDQPLTLARLLDALHQPVDILYLVCHGVYASDGPYLFFQNDDGALSRVGGTELATCLTELIQQPRLAVLASCQSAGSESSADDTGPGALHSLAPMLGEAGVSAIVAMRGNISMETVKLMMPVFFRELLVDGQIERAMAAARGSAVASRRSDFWRPALFLRLRGGRIWYEPGFGQDDDFEKWKSIATHVRDGKFVAIVGAGAGESFYGDSRSLAQQLADLHDFPLSPHRREDLPQVLQYLSISQDSDYATTALRERLQAEILRRQADSIPADLQTASLPKILDALMALPPVGDAGNPYQILASLPGSIYISATPDALMARALKAAGKAPQVLFTNWRRTDTNIPVKPVFKGTPTPQTPVVYQMLGMFGQDNSLVLTENDYFDYIIATVGNDLLPGVVESALVSNSLLFLGFQLTDWSFRVLFRLIQSLEGGNRNANMAHVGVQVNPDDYSLADVEKARHYLQNYFAQEANVALFWGSADDFLKQLLKQLASLPKPASAAAQAQGSDDDWVV